MSKRPRSESDSRIVPAEAKRSKAAGQIAEGDEKVVGESEGPVLETSTDQTPEDLSELGWSHLEQFRRWGTLSDLEKSIEYNSRALALTPDGHPDIADRHASLGMSYSDRYQRLGELADLEKAMECDSRALALTPDGHPDMADRHAYLGVSYGDRYQRLGDLADIEKVIEYFSRALALTPDGHPHMSRRHASLGMSYTDRYQRLGELADLEKAMECHSRALASTPDGHPDMADRHAGLGQSYSDRYQRLGELADLEKAMECHSRALALTPDGHPDMSLRHASLGVSYSDRYNHLDLATRLQTISNQLHSSSFETRPIQPVPLGSLTPEQTGQQRRRLAGEYESLLAQTRQLPGFETFLQPTKAKRLMHAVSSGPVVVINCHKNCCNALFILPGHEVITHLPLPNFDEEKARHAHSALVSSLRRKGLRQRGVSLLLQRGFEDGIESVLKILWGDIVKPVLDYLGYMSDVPREQMPHVTWCPTGPLSFLPLHAAGDYSQPQSRIFNFVISSYTPTLSALLSSTASSLNRNCRVLAVGQATTPGHNPLPGTIKELSHIRLHTQNKAEYSQLIDNQATATSVLDAMECHDWVHLACHAHQNITDPTKSGFFLHDGTLDLTSINQRSFKNKGLAFLSACQTATGDQELPDEAIHLASGMLMAGYPSVIATMWSVVDEDAPFVADKVYAQLMKDGKVGNGEAGKALHNAVAGLREKVGEKEFARWVPYIHIGS